MTEPAADRSGPSTSPAPGVSTRRGDRPSHGRIDPTPTALHPAPDETDPTTGTLELEERSSLRRVPGLSGASTELTDVTEVEYRQLRLERVVLIGVWTEGSAAMADASMVELARLAETAGSEVLDGLVQRRSNARPGHLRRLRQGRPSCATTVVRHRRRHRDRRRRALARPAAPARGEAQGQGRRPDRADPRHLRPARPVAGGQGPGRARPAALLPARACAAGASRCPARAAAPAAVAARVAAASAPVAPVRPSSRRTGGGSTSGSRSCAASSRA